MEKEQLDKLIKENKNDLQKILNDYMKGKYYLTQNQLQKVIDLRRERKYQITQKGDIYE